MLIQTDKIVEILSYLTITPIIGQPKYHTIVEAHL